MIYRPSPEDFQAALYAHRDAEAKSKDRPILRFLAVAAGALCLGAVISGAIGSLRGCRAKDHDTT